MSIRAIQTVLDESTHKGSARLLMVVLANYAHDDGRYAFPSVATMTKYTKLTRRNVQLLLRKLEASGELAEMGIHNSGTTIYRLVLPGFAEGGVKFSSAKRTGASPPSAPGVKSGSAGAKPASPDPSVNHQEPEEDGIPPVSPAAENGPDPWRVLRRLYVPGRAGAAAYAAERAAILAGDPPAAVVSARLAAAISVAKRLGVNGRGAG